MFGAFLELGVSKTRDSETSFDLAVTLPPGQDISTVDAQGQPVREPGKVDAYRFMTFYLSPAIRPPRLVLQPGRRPDLAGPVHRPERQDAQTPIEQALRDLEIDSNYELIKLMAPFVRAKTARYADFRTTVDTTIDRYFPALADHRKEILDFLTQYFDVTGA